MDSRPDTPAPAPPGPEADERDGSFLPTLAIIAVGIAALHFGQAILVPFALALLLTFLLSPLVTRVRRLRIPRVPAVLTVVALAGVLLAGIGALVTSQLVSLANNLPTYELNLKAKIQSLRSAASEEGVVDRTTKMIKELGSEVTGEAEPRDPGPAGEMARDEVPVVRLLEPEPTPLEVLEDLAGPLLGPIGTAGLVVVFVIFMLLEREDLRDRFIRLAGADLQTTVQAMDDAGQRVSRYLLMQLVINASYGIPIGVGLYFIGIPNALLWGVLATLLRFIPYAGPFIAALFPIALSIAVDPGWSMLAWTVGLFVVAELISNNVMEPWLYGASTGMSPLTVIVAAVFWTLLWGPVGLLLATPLTVVLAVVGRYVPQLRFLDVMLGNAPALTPDERFYQRMLAADPDEGVEVAEEHLEDHSLLKFYDDVARPALQRAERDRQRKALTLARRGVVTEGFLTVVAELADHEEADTEEPAREETAASDSGMHVLCAAGRTGLDLAAATMMTQLLQRRGIDARTVSADAIGTRGVATLVTEGVDVILLSYLGVSAATHARQAARRLRRAAPATKIVVGFWNDQLQRLPSSSAFPLAAGSFAEALEQIAALAPTPEQAPPMSPAPIPENETERLQALHRLALLDTPREDALDRYTHRLAAAFKVPVSLLTLVDAQRQFWKSETGLPEELARAREAPRETSICGHVVAENDVLVIEDVRKDRRFAKNPFLLEQGIRFYAGAPLRSAEGLALGSLCVIDTTPRKVTEAEIALLKLVAEEVSRELERRAPTQEKAAKEAS